MPMYEYQCPKCEHVVEVLQRHDEPGPKRCPNCGGRKNGSRDEQHFFSARRLGLVQNRLFFFFIWWGRKLWRLSKITRPFVWCLLTKNSGRHESYLEVHLTLPIADTERYWIVY